jgi:hypothetical protein
MLQVAWSLPLALFMAYKWRTETGPDVSYPCDDGGTCYSGPTTFLILTLVFGGLAVAAIMVFVSLVARWRRRAAERADLLATGLRTPALLVESRATGTSINNRVVQALTFESRATDRVIRVVERSLAHLPIGTRATIAYDPVDPTRAVLADDVEKLATAGQLDWDQLRQSRVDAMFTRPAPESGLSAMRDAVAGNLEQALAELRAEVAAGRMTEQEYEEQRAQWLRLLETRTDQPLT